MVKHFHAWFDATESAGAICQIGFREIGVGSVFDHGGNTIPIPHPSQQRAEIDHLVEL